jgi:hypothetical protein
MCCFITTCKYIVIIIVISTIIIRLLHPMSHKRIQYEIMYHMEAIAFFCISSLMHHLLQNSSGEIYIISKLLVNIPFNTLEKLLL